MASIATAIKLNDQMSNPIKSITNAMNMMLSTWTSLESSTSGGLDIGNVESIRSELDKANRAMESLGNEANQAARGVDNMDNQQQQFNRHVQQGARSMDGLADTITGAVGAYVGLQSLGKLVNLSDSYTQTMARLDMINDGAQTTEQLFNEITESADRSRAKISDTADMVAKLSLNAGDAFASNKEAILFAENLNKLYAIAGTEQAAMASASLQLTQALGSGVLRGEEFNAVFEAAPNIMKTVAEYMNVPIGKLRSMAAEGKITANTVKYALLSATDDINAQFNAMPMTWAQVWTHIVNIAYKASIPILKAINWMAQHWEMLSPVIMGVVAALSIYATTMAVTKALTMAQGFAAAFQAAKASLAAGATFLWTVQQHGLNAALAACPLTWIVLAIIGVIAVFYGAVAAVNEFAGTSISATGIITGAIATLGAFVLNILIGLWNNIASFVELLVNIWKDPEYAIKRFIVNVATNWLNFLLSCITGAESLVGAVVGAFYALDQVIQNVIAVIVNYMIVFIEVLVNRWNSGCFILKSAIVMVAEMFLNFLLSCITGTESMVGAVVGSFYVLDQVIQNILTEIVNFGITFIETFVNRWNKGCFAIKSAFVSIASIVLKVAETILSTMGGLVSSVINGIIDAINYAIGFINDVIDAANEIPFVEIGQLGEVGTVEFDFGADKVAGVTESLYEWLGDDPEEWEAPWDEWETKSLADAYAEGNQVGKDWVSKAADGLNNSIDSLYEWLGDSPDEWEAPWSEWETGSIGDAYAEGNKVGQDWVSDTIEGINKNKSALEAWVGETPEDYWEAPTFDFIDLSEAAKAGYEFGESVDDKVGSMFDSSAWDEYLTEQPILEDAYPTYEELKAIEGNTDDIAGSLDITNENLKYLRDLAEQEAVNRFTTAEIKVEMGGVNNTVNQNTDLDGVINYMVTGVQEAMERAAEGVHN